MSQTSDAASKYAGACIVCWKAGEHAHLIDRSLAPDPYQDPRRIVALCREHHEAYDNHELDLLPYLEPNHRSELARAVECVGLITTFMRVTGATQRGLDEAIEQALGPEIVVNGETVGYGEAGMMAALPKMLGGETEAGA